MRGALSCAIAALSFVSPAAFAATPAYDFQASEPVKDKPTVALASDRAYVYLRSAAAIPIYLVREPEGADLAAYDRFRAAALAEAREKYAKKLAAYAGLVPSTYASGGKCWNGRLIKTGNKWLRWAFVEAAVPAMRAEPALKFDYEHLKVTKGTNRAKVVIARKLLTIAYQVLRDQRDYECRDALERRSNLSRLS